MGDDRGLFGALVGDGRPLLLFTGLCLVLSGLFALFLSATGHFLPHDVQFLGMTAEQLCALHECRIVHFMYHDRVSFGGALVAIGTLYLWLAEFPLRHGQAWSWWLFAVSGVLGFGSDPAILAVYPGHFSCPENRPLGSFPNQTVIDYAPNETPRAVSHRNCLCNRPPNLSAFVCVQLRCNAARKNALCFSAPGTR